MAHAMDRTPHLARQQGSQTLTRPLDLSARLSHHRSQVSLSFEAADSPLHDRWRRSGEPLWHRRLLLFIQDERARGRTARVTSPQRAKSEPRLKSSRLHTGRLADLSMQRETRERACKNEHPVRLASALSFSNLRRLRRAKPYSRLR